MQTVPDFKSPGSDPLRKMKRLKSPERLQRKQTIEPSAVLYGESFMEQVPEMCGWCDERTSNRTARISNL